MVHAMNHSHTVPSEYLSDFSSHIAFQSERGEILFVEEDLREIFRNDMVAIERSTRLRHDATIRLRTVGNGSQRASGDDSDDQIPVRLRCLRSIFGQLSYAHPLGKLHNEFLREDVPLMKDFAHIGNAQFIGHES